MRKKGGRPWGLREPEGPDKIYVEKNRTGQTKSLLCCTSDRFDTNSLFMQGRSYRFVLR